MRYQGRIPDPKLSVLKYFYFLPVSPLSAPFQGQAGQGFEQPGRVEDVPAHGRV